MTPETAIRQKRKRMGLSMEEMGRLVGVTGNRIRDFELGKQPIPINVVKKIIDILELDNALYPIDG